MNEYTTLHDLLVYKGLSPGLTDEGEALKGLVETASRMFDGTARRFFYPKRARRSYDYRQSRELLLDGDLLELLALTTQNGAVAIAPANAYLVGGLDSYDEYPKWRIVLRSDGADTFLYSGTVQKANAVTAVWGYHDDYDGAWPDSLDCVQDDPLSPTAASLTVADADGENADGQAPRFKEQQLLRVEDEFLYVRAVAGDVLSVGRGANGTLKAAHPKGTPILVYKPMADVAHAVLRLAVWLRGQRDSPFMEKTAIPELGQIVIPQAAPVDVRTVAGRYTRRLVRSLER